MSIRIVKLGSERIDGEGLRIGTVRRLPRGVPKSDFSSRNFYDVWLPNISPSPETMKLGKTAQTPKEWQAFKKEMARPENLRILELLAVFSHQTDFSVAFQIQDFRNGGVLVSRRYRIVRKMKKEYRSAPSCLARWLASL